MSARGSWILLLVLALLWTGVHLQWNVVSWDEIEFFRATRWIAEGRVPFRDFWEHHLPLQWFLFAPAAAIFGKGPGVATIVAMRWAQLPIWIGTFALLYRLIRRTSAGHGAPAIALFLLLGSPTFLRRALEFRLDTVGSFGYVAGLALALTRPQSRRAWIAFGAVMAAAVLANMRLVPLVVITSVLLLFFQGEERRWRWNGVALWMVPGAAAMAAAFLAWLFTSGAADGFFAAARYNVESNRLLLSEAQTLLPVLLLPVTSIDLTAIALWLGALAGAVLACRQIRRPSLPQLSALLLVASIALLTTQGVHYDYHLQVVFLLMTPLAASTLANERMQQAAMILFVVAVALNATVLARMPLPAPMRYQDAVMREADRRTLPRERIWDGCGYALRREPAYRYWFLPAGVRMMAARNLIEPYDGPQMAASPPAAIIHSARVHYWLRTFPRLAAYVRRHYLPLYRDLWIPGLNATLAPGQSATWIVPRAGSYRLYASDALVSHPWFTDPLQYAMYAGRDAPRFTVPLSSLPPTDLSRARITIDGMPISAHQLTLRKGSVVRVHSSWSERVAVIIIPDDVSMLFIAPEAGFSM